MNDHPRYRKTYIGDGVYAQYDGYSVVLTTEDGIAVQNTIVLEPVVITALIEFLNDRKERRS